MFFVHKLDFFCLMHIKILLHRSVPEPLLLYDAKDELLITFEETGTIQPNCEYLEGMSIFKSTSGFGLNMSHLEKYNVWKYSETVRPCQTKTQGCCSEDINCSTSFFNEQNNKQYGSFSQNKPTLREFFTPSDVDFDIWRETSQYNKFQLHWFFVVTNGIYVGRGKILKFYHRTFIYYKFTLAWQPILL